jgi:hypothetical protein
MRVIAHICALYCNEHGYLPAYTVDKNGNPLHSWRVLLLPYIEEGELYKKIRLGEPWNSEYNSQFHNYIIPLYQCRSTDVYGRKPVANYFFVTGIGSVFDKTGRYVIDKLQNDSDISNVSVLKNPGEIIYSLNDSTNIPPVLLVDSLKDINWMCPVDVSFDEYKSDRFIPANKSHSIVICSDFTVRVLKKNDRHYWTNTTEIILFCMFLILLSINIIQFCYLLILICFYLHKCLFNYKQKKQ